MGWFQGPMEFGERALGNRSILLEPRRSDGRDVLNQAVKFRESFRPFAPRSSPSGSRLFECPHDARVPFMEQVFPFKPEKQAEVPAVVHVDGSGRLQTVRREDDPVSRPYQPFETLTGVRSC